MKCVSILVGSQSEMCCLAVFYIGSSLGENSNKGSFALRLIYMCKYKKDSITAMPCRDSK